MPGFSHPLAARYLAAQLSGDRREALRIVLEEGLARGMSAHEIHLDVVAVAQREIGRLWEENKISVADEHQATAISHVVLSHVYPSLVREPSTGRRVVVACVEGELHDMGARIAADLLDAAGFDVTYLGANVPTTSLVSKLRDVRADALALSVTMAFHVGSARDTVARVRLALGASFPIVASGLKHFEGSLDGARLSTGSALDLVATIREALGVKRSGHE